METMRTGIQFGYNNPQYFTPEFIITIMKIILIALIASLLIIPICYLLVFIGMFIIFIIDKTKKKDKR